MNIIDVYISAIPKSDAGQMTEMYNRIMSGNAADRISGIKNEAVLKRTIAGELFLRKLLSDRLGTSPGKIEISRTPAGKPYLTANSETYFNLSHSGEKMACAIGSVPLGIDIEKITRARGRVAQKCFCTSEVNILTRSNDPDTAFFRLWTMKEAYLKAEGLGLTVPPKSVDVLNTESHTFLSALINDGYCLSLCAKDTFTAVFHSEQSILLLQDITIK